MARTTAHAFLLTAVALLTGCAAQIMKSYTGKPLTEVVLDYGPPVNAFDVGDGRRAFTWKWSGTVMTPGSATTYGHGYGSVTAIGNTAYGSASYYGHTTITPPQAFDYTCFYTIFATRQRQDIEGPGAWRVVGYREPNLGCQ